MSDPITAFKIQVAKTTGPLYERGWDFFPTDLNTGAGGNYVYLGYQCKNGQPPVTSMDVGIYESPPSNPPSGWYWDMSDLNSGASASRHPYLLWKVGESKPPIINVMVGVYANAMSSPPQFPGWVGIPKDLNAGVGGPYIWLYYSTTVPMQFK